MQLLIMRHGEAESAFSKDIRDADRSLTEIGHRQTSLAGRCLQENNFEPEVVWVSPYRRAQQTATNVTQAFHNDARIITMPFLIPEGIVVSVLEELEAFRKSSVMIVSHQPLVADLVSRLSGQSQDIVPVMAPASMVLLQGDHLIAGLCNIIWHRHSPDFETQH